MSYSPAACEGILLVDKPAGKTSFSLIAALRKRIGVKTIGHAGTLDPFATGLMVLLVGRPYTRLSNSFLGQDKEYLTDIRFGIATDTYDHEGKIVSESSLEPTLENIVEALQAFQGEIEQIPPMYSAKKVQGRKLYEYARQGKTIERKPVRVHLNTELIAYQYPFLTLRIVCSKGTYVRSIAHDLGCNLGCGAHLSKLQRIRSGKFHLKDSVDGSLLDDISFDRESFKKSIYVGF